MREPFESAEKANENLERFAEELYELRAKYRIRDLLFAIRVGALDEDGEEGEATVVAHYGDEAVMEGLAAYTYGRMSSDRQARMMEETRRATRTAVRNVERRK